MLTVINCARVTSGNPIGYGQRAKCLADIFYLPKLERPEEARWYRDLFKRVRSRELKDKIIFSLSQQRNTGSEQWLLDIAVDQSESTEIRKQALFWAAQNRGIAFERLAQLYDRTNDAEIKEQLIFGFSQRGNSREAVDKLMSIARNDRDKEMRKKAIFWLGQSRDPRVLDTLSAAYAASGQIALARQGISPGSADGVMGLQTRAALRAFQRREGLPQTGALDADTRARLVLSNSALTRYFITTNDLARLRPLSHTWLGKSQQSALDYETALELVGRPVGPPRLPLVPATAEERERIQRHAADAPQQS